MPRDRRPTRFAPRSKPGFASHPSTACAGRFRTRRVSRFLTTRSPRSGAPRPLQAATLSARKTVRHPKLFDWLALAALIALAILRSSVPLNHDDLFGHLSTGEWIVSHGKVPL